MKFKTALFNSIVFEIQTSVLPSFATNATSATNATNATTSTTIPPRTFSSHFTFTWGAVDTLVRDRLGSAGTTGRDEPGGGHA